MSSLVVNTSQAQSSNAANAVKEAAKDVAKAQATVMPVSYHKQSSWRYLFLSFFGFLHHFVLTAFSFDTK